MKNILYKKKKINWKYVFMIGITIVLLYVLFGRMNTVKENNENMNIMESVFTKIYDTNEWGNNNNKEYNGSSGEGSDVSVNINTYVPFLKEFIQKNNIKSVVDLGCGDVRCGHLIYDDLDVTYTGYDTYKKIIEYNSRQYSKPKYTFIHSDFCNKKDQIINADMCILKDVLQHWSLDNIYTFLDYIIANKKFKYILITNCCHQKADNTEIKTGSFRPLSSEYLPLKKYSPKKVYKYHTKEVCLIEL